VFKRAKHGTVNNVREELTSISKMGVVSAFREFSFGNNLMGVYGSLPFETLHAWLLGIMEYIPEGVFSHVPPQERWLYYVKRFTSPIL
jgi:peptide subunit release factor RF-3